MPWRNVFVSGGTHTYPRAARTHTLGRHAHIPLGGTHTYPWAARTHTLGRHAHIPLGGNLLSIPVQVQAKARAWRTNRPCTCSHACASSTRPFLSFPCQPKPAMHAQVLLVLSLPSPGSHSQPWPAPCWPAELAGNFNCGCRVFQNQLWWPHIAKLRQP